ncbi:MAG TPA: ISNCY family transposase [Candidatus Acidoferrales bacterium]|nr:ISNCY family transposase [Candidatus Acidoferrales bacterium]
MRHQQPSLWHSGLAKDIEDLWEPWMREVDQLLEDAMLVEEVYEAQGERHAKSRTRGRTQTPAEVVLRLLILKHVRNWSYDTLEREVRANLVYRAFTRIGDEKVPDAKTLARLGQAIGPGVIKKLHERLMELARERGLVQGRKMRVDTTVVETNIHYPTDSSLLGDGARVLTRTMKKVEKATGGLKKRIRDRMRSVNKKVIAIALVGRLKGVQGEERRVQCYRELVSLTRQILNQAKDVLEEISDRRQAHLKPLRQVLETMSERVRQVIRQTKARVFQGITQYPHKILSVFEPHTEIIRKGKASKPNEFGKLVQVQEAENQIITHYEVFAARPEDSQLLVPAVEKHQHQFGRAPRMVAADTGFYSLKNERAIQAMGVRRVAVPSRSTKSSERRKLQRTRWFRSAQRWRTGCEGRISVLKRRHGLSRCRYRGFGGMQRWVGLGVVADNVIQIGRCMAMRTA